MLTNLRAELTNKVIMSVGNESITNYDVAREVKYLSVITLGQFKNLSNQESKKIAIDSLIKDKVKTNELAKHDYITVRDEMVNNHIYMTSKNIGFENVNDFKKYLEFEEYKFDEFQKKIILELKWNQLIYQFYKNQIIIDKEKIDKKLKELISKQQKKYEYLIYEIFIEDSANEKLNKKKSEKVLVKNGEKELVENNNAKRQNGIIIETETFSYDNKKNLIEAEKSVEEVIDSEKEVIELEKHDQISVDELIKAIEEKGFESAAIQFSSSTTSQQGGRLGWINESEFSENLLKFVKNTKIGNITEPIIVPGGMLILKVENKRAEKNEIDLDKKMRELIEVEKNNQLNQFSTNYFNQVKNNVKIKYLDD